MSHLVVLDPIRPRSREIFAPPEAKLLQKNGSMVRPFLCFSAVWPSLSKPGSVGGRRRPGFDQRLRHLASAGGTHDDEPFVLRSGGRQVLYDQSASTHLSLHNWWKNLVAINRISLNCFWFTPILFPLIYRLIKRRELSDLRPLLLSAIVIFFHCWRRSFCPTMVSCSGVRAIDDFQFTLATRLLKF